jgi:3-deoxy-7-phosphoheptulonate synthase
MLIVMDSQATAEDVRRVVSAVEGLGLAAHAIPGAQRTAIGVTGNRGSVESAAFENLPGVAEVIAVTAPYKLVSREAKREDTVVSVGGVAVGGPQVTVVAGPCAVESEEQALSIARHVRAAGATLYRGGAFKPRTSPYSFQGLGEPALKILARVREETGLPIVTEVLDTENAELVAEYVLSEGNYEVILCERGVRTFANHTRNTLDLSVIPYVKRISHLPIMVDPSHGTGKRLKVLPMSRAAIAAGSDGLLIEVHDHPELALSDGPQALLPDMFAQLMKEVRLLAPVVGRTA